MLSPSSENTNTTSSPQADADQNLRLRQTNASRANTLSTSNVEKSDVKRKPSRPLYAFAFFSGAVWLCVSYVALRVIFPHLDATISDYFPLSTIPTSTNTYTTPSNTTSSISTLIHPKVDIEHLPKNVSPVREYTDLVLSVFPQEASQGRIPCNVPSPTPTTLTEIPEYPFGNNLKFAMVADMDHRSRDPVELLWHSYIKTGTLNRNPTTGNLTISWDRLERISTNLAANNRSIELSEIVWFNERFLTVCDYTGVVYTIRPIASDIFPRFILADGDGRSSRTFKSEWMTVYNDTLYIGSHGKEWVRDGTIIARGAEWVKEIDTSGKVNSIDWGQRYQFLRKAANATFPGYLTHESVLWHEPAKMWVFLPRKHSTEGPFDDLLDERRGTNLLILVDEAFENAKVLRVGPLEPEWGFASVARIPGTSYMLGSKVLEIGDVTKSKITIFDLEGNILIDPPFVDAGDFKFEGVEFVGDFESL